MASIKRSCRYWIYCHNRNCFRSELKHTAEYIVRCSRKTRWKMKQFPWIIFALIAMCSVHVTMANLQRQNSTAEYIPAPTLFRSVFAGRPALGYPKDPAPAKEESEESKEEHLLDEADEENSVDTEDGSEESDEDDNSNESRIKKSASSDESGSDEDESDEDESDEDESDESDEQDEKSSRKPSRWRQTRYGSSFRIQTVGRPINYGRHHSSRDTDTPRY